MESTDTLIIGGGQAGLALSYFMTQQGRDHLILEKDTIGSAWQHQRWDSFTLVTPNWTLQLPGMAYGGDDPGGFLTRQETVDYLDRYVETFKPPVREGVEARRVRRAEGSDRLKVSTDKGEYEADNAVVAVGTFQRPSLPGFSEELSPDLGQFHSSEYRNPDQLPPGAVLVVGSGQSGSQIAEELFEAGREVYLSTSRVRRFPRRYRGRDVTRWLVHLGVTEQTVDQLDSPAERFEPNAHISGKDGGKTINLHRFARDGIHLLGRLQDGRDRQVAIKPNLRENLRFADRAAREFRAGVDKFIERSGIEAPDPEVVELRAGYEVPIMEELDLEEAGVRSVLWATGYKFNYSWVQFDIFDDYGYPIQNQGVTAEHGLYFLGLHWLHTIKSGLFVGVGEDAANVAEHIDARS